MPKLSEATLPQVNALLDAADPKVGSAKTFDGAAQVVTEAVCQTYRDSCVLARVFVSTPFKSLPPTMSTWVSNLAKAKGVASGLTPDTQVLALAGTAGHKPEWCSRTKSQGHVGIPLISKDFIQAIPMMARLVGSMGRDLSWLDTKDATQLVKAMSRLSGRFYVPDASATVDSAGRKVISDQAFVSANKVGTVFGVANSSVMANGALMALLVFSNETIPEKHVDVFSNVLSRLRSKTTGLMSPDKLFAN